jgi:hypothetical protein
MDKKDKTNWYNDALASTNFSNLMNSAFDNNWGSKDKEDALDDIDKADRKEEKKKEKPSK